MLDSRQSSTVTSYYSLRQFLSAGALANSGSRAKKLRRFPGRSIMSEARPRGLRPARNGSGPHAKHFPGSPHQKRINAPRMVRGQRTFAVAVFACALSRRTASASRPRPAAQIWAASGNYGSLCSGLHNEPYVEFAFMSSLGRLPAVDAVVAEFGRGSSMVNST